jgi:hypothetical protein
MKPIIIPAVRIDRRKAYAVHRMDLAAQRLLHADTISDEIRAGQWVLAWAVAAGARPSARSMMDSLVPLVPFSLH